MKRTCKIISEIVIYAIIFLVAILLIWSAIPVKNNPKIFVVLSGSMEPYIHTGSVIITKPVSNYKVGDIITFGENSKIYLPTTHRIVEIKKVNDEIVYRTKGSANDSEDIKEIPQKEVLGKVFFSIPYLGFIVDFAKKPLGFFLVVGIPAIFIIYEEIKKIIREVKKVKEKKLLEQKSENKE